MTRKPALLTLLILALVLVSACGLAVEEPPADRHTCTTDRNLRAAATATPGAQRQPLYRPLDTPVPPTGDTCAANGDTGNRLMASAVADDAMAYYGPARRPFPADDLFANLNDGDAENDLFISVGASLEDDTSAHPRRLQRQQQGTVHT